MNPKDPIKEIWRIREAMSAEEGYDVHRLFERLRREEKNFEARLVRTLPRRFGAIRYPPHTGLTSALLEP
jgi:hypothetical protein